MSHYFCIPSFRKNFHKIWKSMRNFPIHINLNIQLYEVKKESLVFNLASAEEFEVVFIYSRK